MGSFGVPLSDSRMGNREARYVDWTSSRLFILVLKGFRDTWGASGQPRQATDGSEKPEIPASAYEQDRLILQGKLVKRQPHSPPC